MAKDTSPLCSRLPPEDRRMIETVAAYFDQSVSDFVRTVAVEAAAKVLRDEGTDKIFQVIGERTERLSEENRRVIEAKSDRPSGLRAS